MKRVSGRGRGSMSPRRIGARCVWLLCAVGVLGFWGGLEGYSTSAFGERIFPPLSHYRIISSFHYLHEGAEPDASFLMFSTQGGLFCYFSDAGAACQGYDIPHFPEKVKVRPNYEISARTLENVHYFRATQHTEFTALHSLNSLDRAPVLLPGFALRWSDSDAVCLAGKNNLTACRVGEHGFVISATQTYGF